MSSAAGKHPGLSWFFQPQERTLHMERFSTGGTQWKSKGRKAVLKALQGPRIRCTINHRQRDPADAQLFSGRLLFQLLTTRWKQETTGMEYGQQIALH